MAELVGFQAGGWTAMEVADLGFRAVGWEVEEVVAGEEEGLGWAGPGWALVVVASGPFLVAVLVTGVACNPL